MGKALLLASSNNQSIALNNRGFGAGSSNITTNAGSGIHTRSAVKVGVDGVLSKLAAYYVDASGTARTLRVRINDTSVNEIISPGDGATGLVEDNTNTDAISVGDTLHHLSNVSTAAQPISWVRVLFEADSGHAAIYNSCGLGGADGANVVTYHSLAGNSNANATEALTQLKMRVAGTLQYASVAITTNTRSDTTTLVTRVNGVTGNASVAVGAGLTGHFEDSSNSDAVVTGDLINFMSTTGGGTGTIAKTVFGGTVVVASGAANDVFGANVGGNTRNASATPAYYIIGGSVAQYVAEASAAIQHGFQVHTSNVRVLLSSNTYSVAATATLRVAGADGNQTFQIGGGLTGWIEDTTHSDLCGATDGVALRIVGGSSGSISMRAIGITEQDPAAAAVQAIGDASGVGTASGVGVALVQGVGNAAGVGTATGIGASTNAGVGNAAGSGVATGVGAATFAGAGASAGAGVATGIGAAIHTTVGNAAGVGAALGIGASTAASVGSAMGLATVLGIGTTVIQGAGSAAGVAEAEGFAVDLAPIILAQTIHLTGIYAR